MALNDRTKRSNPNLEWWYCYSFLSGNHGSRYALAVSFFQVGELPVLKGHYLIYSLIRLDDGKVETRSLLDQKLARLLLGLYLPVTLITHPQDRQIRTDYKALLKGTVPYPHLLMNHASVKSDPTRLRYGNSQLTFGEQPDSTFHLLLSDISFRINLDFHPVKPLSAIDEQGKLNKYHYYSLTRNQIMGEIQLDGVTETLTGEGWFDHQWGRDYGLFFGMGWDWFGLQLEDGRELLISRLHSPKSDSIEAPAAKLIKVDGTIHTSDHVLLKPLQYWRSLYTGAKYPVEWQITLPEFSLDLHITPMLKNQEIPILGPIKAIWEGACTLNGTECSQMEPRHLLREEGLSN
jgi:predicted secreted hydrolase